MYVSRADGAAAVVGRHRGVTLEGWMLGNLGFGGGPAGVPSVPFGPSHSGGGCPESCPALCLVSAAPPLAVRGFPHPLRTGPGHGRHHRIDHVRPADSVVQQDVIAGLSTQGFHYKIPIRGRQADASVPMHGPALGSRPSIINSKAPRRAGLPLAAAIISVIIAGHVDTRRSILLLLTSRAPEAGQAGMFRDAALSYSSAPAPPSRRR
ncbi:hypothetical protein Purlil1_9226 [Purpureocillium lilacinum]|uniref:Uncharacterized protein n=1 Tax=Purpureocillium lilacinum TaxID=33203 RepID=A0ABR0BQT1_PURLI|nr:hypothetical protein Purlil1_9226 [Purpureocillium lilacinum]